MSLAGVRPELCVVPLGSIDEPELPSRSKMNDEKLDELTASIRAIGFISTIALVREADRYRVVAGHRRTVAARRAGLVAVPALVYPSSADALEAIQHAENKHREELNPADESIWFAQLLEKYPDDGTDGVAARVGEKRAFVEDRLALLQGCERVFDALAGGRIGVGVAQELNRCTNPQYRVMLLDQAIKHGATKSIVTGWVAEWRTTIQPAIANVNLAAPAVTTGSTTPYEFFICGACDQKDNAADMRPLNFHTYCIQSQLRPALDMFRHRSDYRAWPRTIDQARELAAELVERFPELIPE